MWIFKNRKKTEYKYIIKYFYNYLLFRNYKRESLFINKINFFKRVLDEILLSKDKTNIIINDSLLKIIDESIKKLDSYKDKNLDIFNIDLTKIVKEIKEKIIEYQFKKFIIDNLKVKEKKTDSVFKQNDNVVWFNKKNEKFVGVIKEIKNSFAIIINSENKEVKIPLTKLNIDRSF